MTEGAFDKNELLQLLGALRDELITPEQMSRLEGILSASPAARSIYFRFQTMLGLLEQSAVAIPTPLPRAAPSRRALILTAALAAAVLIAIAPWWLLTRERDPVQPHVVWQAIPSGNAQLVRLTPTSLRLDRGEVRIQVGKLEGKDPPMIVATPAGQVDVHAVSGTDVLIEVLDSSLEEKGADDMKTFTRVLVLAGVATLMNGQGSITGEANSLLAAEPKKAPTKHAVEANSGFGLDLYRQLAKQNEGKNVFFSPYSLSLALAMAAEGARGDTADEMGKVLHFPKAARRVGADAQLIPWETSLIHTGLAQLSRELHENAEKGKDRFDLRIANALWGEQTYPFNPQYVKTLKESFGIGGALPCDFVGNAETERKRINDWVSERTNQRIQNLLPPGTVNRETLMVLTNAIYFRGDWVQKFDKRQTKSADFTTLAGTKVKAPLMFGKFDNVKFAFVGKGEAAKSLATGAADNFRLLELPYKGGLSMVLLATDNPRGLPQLEAQLTPENLASWLGRLEDRDTVEVRLPRFKFETAYELPEILAQLGMKRAFQAPGPDGADFSGMSQSGRRELGIGGVFHKAFIAVNEEGTEAAAATGIPFVGGPMPPPPPQFFADRPFVFLIRDPQSKTILFMGRVVDAVGAANNDRSEAQETSLKQARTNPAKHPLAQQLKDAAGVSLCRTYRDKDGLMSLDGDGDTGIILECRTVLPLKGDLKAGSVERLLFSEKVRESDAARAFTDFFSPTYTEETMLVIHHRKDKNTLVVDAVIEADEAAQLVAAHVFAVPVEKLATAVKTGK